MGETTLRPALMRVAGLLTGLLAAVTSGIVATPTEADAATSVAGCGATIRMSNGTAWRCTFADNFSGTALDRTKWLPVTTKESGYNINKDCYFDSTRNIRVTSGTLRLTSRRTSTPITCSSPSGSYASSYTSGTLSSLGRFSQTRGRFEIRAKFPSTSVRGAHSAWWLWPVEQRYGGWPYAGEIDIAEYYTQYPDRAIPYVHYVTRDASASAVTNTGCMVKNPSAFHTYTLVWTSTVLRISFDGKTCVRHTLRPALGSLGQLLGLGAPFDAPFNLTLTQGVGAGENAPTSRTSFPATTVVDYVRVWS